VEGLVELRRPVVSLGLGLGLAFLIAEVWPADCALNERLEHALGTPLESIGGHDLHSNLVLAGHWVREDVDLDGDLTEAFLVGRVVLAVLGHDEGLDKRVGGLCVEGECIVEAGELRRLLDEGLFKAVAVGVEEALYLVEAHLHHLALLWGKVALARPGRVAGKKEVVGIADLCVTFVLKSGNGD